MVYRHLYLLLEGQNRIKIKLVQMYTMYPLNDGPTRNLILNTKQLILFMDLCVNLILILYYDYRRLLVIKNIVLQI